MDPFCWSAKSMMIDFGENVAQCVLGRNNSSAKSIREARGAHGFDICIVLCYGCKNVLSLVNCTLRNGRCCASVVTA